MAQIHEKLVEEWLRRQRYFTIRSAKFGVSEIDLLAMSVDHNGKITRRHVEVQISFRPVGFITGKSAKKELKKREIGGEELENRAGAIAYSAIKYSILKVSPEKNVTFDWEHALAFEGDTGPYLQYAYARICSILSKHGEELDKNIDFTLLKKTEETNLIKKLEEFPSIVKSAEEELRPHLIATYIYSLSRLLSEFYHKCNVLKEKDKLKKARLVLIDSVRQVLKNGLNLLGIDVLERM